MDRASEGDSACRVEDSFSKWFASTAPPKLRCWAIKLEDVDVSWRFFRRHQSNIVEDLVASGIPLAASKDIVGLVLNELSQKDPPPEASEEPRVEGASPSLAIFWDLQRMPIPRGQNMSEVVADLKDVLAQYGRLDLLIVYDTSQQMPSNLHLPDCHLIVCPTSDVVRERIICDAMEFAFEHPDAATLVFVTGSTNYAALLSKLKKRPQWRTVAVSRDAIPLDCDIKIRWNDDDDDKMLNEKKVESEMKLLRDSPESAEFNPATVTPSAEKPVHMPLPSNSTPEVLLSSGTALSSETACRSLSDSGFRDSIEREVDQSKQGDVHDLDSYEKISSRQHLLAKLKTLRVEEADDSFVIGLLARNPSFVVDVIISAYQAGVRGDAGAEERRSYFRSITKLFDSLYQRSVCIGYPVGYTLTHAVEKRLEDLVLSGFCSKDDVEKLIKNNLRILPEKCALVALERLSQCERASIQKLGNFLASVIMKDVLQDERGHGASKEDSNHKRLWTKLKALPLGQDDPEIVRLKKQPDFVIDAVIAAYETGAERDAAEKKRRAFCASILRLFVSLYEDSLSAGVPMGYDFTHVVEERIEGLVRSGFCSHRGADKLIRSKLSLMSEQCALAFLDRLAQCDRSSIRDVGSFLISIMKEVLQDQISLVARLRTLPVEETDDAFQILARNRTFVVDAVIDAYETSVDESVKYENRRNYFWTVTRLFDELYRLSLSTGRQPMGYGLTPAVKERLDNLIRLEKCSQDDVNKVVRGKLTILPEESALEVLNRLERCPRSSIRKLGHLLVTIMKEVLREKLDNSQSVQKRRPGNDVLEPTERQLWKRQRRSSW